MLKGTGSGGGAGLEPDFPAANPATGEGGATPECAVCGGGAVSTEPHGEGARRAPAAGLRGCVRGVLGRAPVLVAGEAEGEEGETERALAESDEGEGGPALSPLAAATALAVLTLVLPALVSGEQEGDAACCVSLGDGGGDAAPDGESGEEREAGCHGIGL